MEVSTEVEFAQKLASNEKKERDKAIKKLRKYFSAKAKVGFSEEDYLKIWKGLHYCMWMQDKPLIQEELSTNITRIVHILKNHTQALLFVKVFFLTEAREWSGIDVWRIDKFMMFVRHMLNQTLTYLKNHSWNQSVIKEFVDVISDSLLDSSNDEVPDGIRIHLSDIYLSELSRVGGKQLTVEQVTYFLSPFINFIKNARNLHVINRVISAVFQPMIFQTIEHFKKKHEKEKGDADDDDDDDDGGAGSEVDDGDDDVIDEMTGKVKLKFPYDCGLIADKLLEVCSKPNCGAKNRRIIYRLVKRLRNAAQGRLPVPMTYVGDDKVEMKEINRAVKALQSMELNFLKDKQKKKKKKKNIQDEFKISNLLKDESVSLPNGKRKRKSTEESGNKKTQKISKSGLSDSSTGSGERNENTEPMDDDGADRKKKKTANKKKKKTAVSSAKGYNSVSSGEVTDAIADNKDNCVSVAKLKSDTEMKLKSDSQMETKSDSESKLTTPDSSAVENENPSPSPTKHKKRKRKKKKSTEGLETSNSSPLPLEANKTAAQSSPSDGKPLPSASEKTENTSDDKQNTKIVVASASSSTDTKDVLKVNKAENEMKTDGSHKQNKEVECKVLASPDVSAAKSLKSSSTNDLIADGSSTSPAKKKKKRKSSLKTSENKNSISDSDASCRRETRPSLTVDENEVDSTTLQGVTKDSVSDHSKMGTSPDSSNVCAEDGSMPSTQQKKKTEETSGNNNNNNNNSSFTSDPDQEQENMSSMKKKKKKKKKRKSSLDGGNRSLTFDSDSSSQNQMELSDVTAETVSSSSSSSSASSTKKNKNKKTQSLEASSMDENDEERSNTEENKEKLNTADEKEMEELKIEKNLMMEFIKAMQEGEEDVTSTKSERKMKSSFTEVTKKEKKMKILSPSSSFGHFEKSPTPVAFVRKPATPHTMPRKRKLEKANEADGQCLSTAKKRVSFDPSRNMSLEFRDSVNFSSDSAFRPDKSPSQGILKSPAPVSSSKKKQKLVKRVSKNLIFESPKSSRGIETISEISAQKKKKSRQSSERAVTRSRAAEFF